jgi:hypothetical protein
MSKEQTPITAEGFYLNNRGDLLRSNLGTKEFTIDMMEQYANAKVLEALEPIVDELTKGLQQPERKVSKAFICKRLLGLIETEVKTKYVKSI